jgi:hypothetical protein
MRCTHCNVENRSGARFCAACGEPLEVVETPPEATSCATCGASVKPGARFCPRCGAEIGQAIAANEGSGGSASRPTWAEDSGREAVPPSVTVDVSPAGGSVSRPTWAEDSGREAVPHSATVDVSLAGVSAQPPPPRQRRAAWPLAIVVALLSGACFLCAVIGFAAAPAFGGEVQSVPVVDPNRPDITILVEEAYISDMVKTSLPASIGGAMQLDVQPGNQIVATMEFSLILIRLQVTIHSRIAVEAGQMRVGVERIETGGQNLLELIGIDQITLGDEITGAIQKVLEDELGPGSRLLAIATDENRVTLTARWE